MRENHHSNQDTRERDQWEQVSPNNSIEIPKNQWEGFVEIMASQGNQSENLFFKFAGIYNLGLIMENTDLQEMQESD